MKTDMGAVKLDLGEGTRRRLLRAPLRRGRTWMASDRPS